MRKARDRGEWSACEETHTQHSVDEDEEEYEFTVLVLAIVNMVRRKYIDR